MAFTLRYHDQPNEALDQLEQTPDAPLTIEVNDLLAKLADDPGDRQLRSKEWTMPTWGQVHSTPVPATQGTDPPWVMVWRLGVEPTSIEIVYIGSES